MMWGEKIDQSKEKQKKKKRKGKDEGEEDEHLQRAPGAFLAGVILIYGEKYSWEGSLDHFRDPLGWGGSVAYERIEKERIEKRNKTNKKQAQQKAISHIRETMKADDLPLPKDPFCPPEPQATTTGPSSRSFRTLPTMVFTICAFIEVLLRNKKKASRENQGFW